MPATTPAAVPPEAPARTRPITVFLGNRVLTTTHRGQMIYVPPTDVGLAPQIIMGGLWEPHVERAAFGQLRPGDVAADTGANVGYHTVAMAAAVGHTGRIHAFEASPDLVRLLRPTLSVNGLREVVTLHHRAVMDRPGMLTLASAPGHFGSGNILPPTPNSHYDTDHSRRHEVEGATLDTMLADVASLDLIRMDIEGSEPQALRGGRAIIARSPRIGIVAEWSVGKMAARADLGAFVDWLSAMGFRFWLVSPTGTLFQPVDRSALLGLPHSDVFISRQGPI